MLGPWSAPQLAGSACAGHPLPNAGTACRPAIEDGLATLQSTGCPASGRSLRNDRRFVHRPRPGLRHHHAARRRCGRFAVWAARYGSLCRLRGNPGCASRGASGGGRGFRHQPFYGRRLQKSGRRRHRRDCRRSRVWRLGRGLLHRAGLPLARGRRRGRLDRRATRGRRRHHNQRPRGGYGPSWWLGDDCARGRPRSNGWTAGRRGYDRWSRARLWNNLARLGARWRSNSLSWNCRRRRCGAGGRCGRLRRRRCCRLGRHVRMARHFLFFVLLGQDGLQHIAGLGNVRKVNLGDDGLRGMTRRRAACMRGRFCILGEVCAHLFRFVRLQRARVSLHSLDPKLGKEVDNCARLHFQLARQIVDTNLAHPPLFGPLCRQSLVAHSYLMTMAA